MVSSLAVAGLVSATVISKEELEANKPQILPTQNGNTLCLDWEAQPEVYYFVEGSPDLTTWLTGKLLKDTDQTGNLELDTAIGPDKAFYRLSLEGDPDSARLRADNDGDKIINLLEADAGEDAFEFPISEDTDADGIPDYWEQFHFGTLEHDANYIATEGGLTLAEAYAAGTDPNEIDSDGDGWTDLQEIEWGWDPNYDQSRDDSTYGGDGDWDGDSILNRYDSEPANSFKIFSDADGDGIPDDIDPSPNSSNGTPPSIQILGLHGISHYVNGDQVTLFLKAKAFENRSISAADINAHFDGNSVSASGFTITSIGNNLFEASFTAESKVEPLQSLSFLAVDSENAQAWSNAANVDIAEVELFITLIGYIPSASPAVAPLTFLRQLNGEMQIVNATYSNTYRGPATFELNWQDQVVKTLTVEPDQTSVGYLYLPNDESRTFDNSFASMSNRQISVINLSGMPVTELRYGQVDTDVYPSDILVGTTTVANSELVTFDPIGDLSLYDYAGGEHSTVFVHCLGTTTNGNSTQQYTMFNNGFSQSFSERIHTILSPPHVPGSGLAVSREIKEQVSPITLTAHSASTVDLPSQKLHPLNNLKAFNWVVQINDDFDEGNVDSNGNAIFDYNDTMVGSDDDDIAKLNIKVDADGSQGLNELFVKVPVDDEGNNIVKLYTRNAQGGLSSIQSSIIRHHIKGVDLKGIMIDISDTSSDPLKSELMNADGLDLYFEGLECKIDASFEVHMGLNDDFQVGAQDEVRIELLKVDLISPAGNHDNDPILKPIDGGDGTGDANGIVSDGANEFTFSTATNGVLTIQFKAEVGGGSTVLNAIKDKVTFSIENVGQAPTWDPANLGGKASVSGNYLVATATFTGLPANNSDFGKKKVEILLDGSVVEESEIEVFYDGFSTNHPGAGAGSTPNWFYYYKQNEGGGDYGHESDLSRRSHSISGGGDASIKLAQDSYAPNGANDINHYFETQIVDGQLRIVSLSSIQKYYANFIGVLSHERFHANDELSSGSANDDDFDNLSNSFENENNLDPNDPFSASTGVSIAAGIIDNEAYAGGPVEENAILNADTSEDWANPGTNYGLESGDE